LRNFSGANFRIDRVGNRVARVVAIGGKLAISLGVGAGNTGLAFPTDGARSTCPPTKLWVLLGARHALLDLLARGRRHAIARGTAQRSGGAARGRRIGARCRATATPARGTGRAAAIARAGWAIAAVRTRVVRIRNRGFVLAGAAGKRRTAGKGGNQPNS